MGFARHIPFFVIVTGLLLSLVSQPVFARSEAQTAPGAGCTARVPAASALNVGDRVDLDWQCDGSIPDLGPGRIAVALGQAAAGEGYMTGRTGYFDELLLILVQDQRIIQADSHSADSLLADRTNVSFSVALPAGTGQQGTGSSYIAIYDNAEFPSTISATQLVQTPVNERSDTLAQIVIIAMIMGFLLLPVVLDLAFYRVLRADFLLWHAGLAVAMAWHLSSSGLLAVFTPVSVTMMNHHAILSFGAVVVCAVMFATCFIERDKQAPRLRVALQGWAGLVLALTLLRMVRLDGLGPYSAKLYFAAFLPLIILMITFLYVAVRRGSRAVWFQLLAWLPFIGLGTLRLASMLGTDASYIEAVWLFRAGAATEVTFTALGIVDRVIILKRERDAALTEARTLEKLSVRDELTGLLNRRGLEAQFDEFLARGYDTFALIDLDRFKQVNDTYGHQIGDAALVACAKALRDNFSHDLIAARLGGEEFVVLLRGQRTVQRAEALREAIPLRIATDVAGLDMLVTASMGMVEVPRSGHAMMDFQMLYARADELMYEAKATGRNRSAYERLTVFPRPNKDDTEGPRKIA